MLFIDTSQLEVINEKENEFKIPSNNIHVVLDLNNYIVTKAYYYKYDDFGEKVKVNVDIRRASAVLIDKGIGED